MIGNGTQNEQVEEDSDHNGDDIDINMTMYK